MGARSIMNMTHRNDGARLSSSLPQPILSQGISGPFPSQNASSSQSRQEQLTLDQSTLARRTTAQRQLHGNSKPLLRRILENKDRHIRGRSSTLASQPVLVRSYTPEINDPQSSTSMSLNSPMQTVDLPPIEEFGIEAILRAIEPDIRSTLDSIAEICGRSKLSLANEYGSHIAPFGEVNPISGELLAIQETTSSNEDISTDIDGNIVIVDEDHELYGSSLGLLDDLRQTAFITGFQQSSRVSRGDEINETSPENSRRPKNLRAETQSPVMSVARMEQFLATSKPDSKALLGNSPSKVKNTKTATMTSPALLSETHLDAQGNRSSWPSVPPDTPHGSPILHATAFTENGPRHKQNTIVDRIALIADVQEWLCWLKTIVQREKRNQQMSYSQSYSAENSLRELLIKNQDQTVILSTA